MGTPPSMHTRVSAILVIAAIAAFAATALFLVRSSVPASAHQTGGSGNHFLFVKTIPTGGLYAVSVQDHAGTYESRSGQVMLTSFHRNTVNITNGKCDGISHPLSCFGDLGSPEIEYTHENDGHHLLDSRLADYWIASGRSTTSVSAGATAPRWAGSPSRSRRRAQGVYPSALEIPNSMLGSRASARSRRPTRPSMKLISDGSHLEHPNS